MEIRVRMSCSAPRSASVTGALGESFTERVWDIAQRYTLPGATANMKYVVAALGDDSGIVGAAAYARSKVGPAL